jgi:hypothetical protein
MDFVISLPRSPSRQDTIWVIIDRLTKSAHFLPNKVTDSMDKLAEIYVRETNEFLFPLCRTVIQGSHRSFERDCMRQ